MLENSTALIGDLMAKSWVYWQWIFATIKSTIDTVKCSNTIQLSPFECNTEHKNVFLHITGRKKITHIKVLRNVVDDFGT